MARASARFLLRHPAQAALTVLGIALGVAVVAGMDLANTSARRGFEAAGAATGGAATHRLVGGPEGLDERLFPALRRRLPEVAAAPVVAGTLVLEDRAFELLGIDPFTDAAVRPHLGGERPFDLGALMTRPGALLLSRDSAERLGLRPGATAEGRAGGARHPVVLVGLLEPRDEVSGRALSGLAVADIATAQELLGRPGRLDRIDLVLAAGQEAALAAALPAGVRLVPAADTRAQMTRAFRWNLTALSLLALLCGAFLIYNTLLFSIVQRREVLGILRTLGVSRRRLLAVVLGEAAVLGAVGSALGLLGGLALARGLLGLVTRTIDDLWFALEVQTVTADPAALAKAALLGLGASVVAALTPALEAAATQPGLALQRSQLESRAAALAPRAAIAGGLALLIAGGVLALPSRNVGLAFVAVFVGLLGAALVIPWAVGLAARATAPPLGALFGALGRLVARGVGGSLSRTAVAAAALAVALAVTAGVGVMIGSFRGSVEAWLDSSLAADLYLGSESASVGGPRQPLAPQLLAAVAADPAVAAINRLRVVELATAEGPLRLMAVDLQRDARRSYPLVAGDEAAAWKAFAAGNAVLVSETLAWHRGLAPGDAIALPAPAGEWRAPVGGVFRDYAGDQGAVLVDLAAYRQRFGDQAVTGLGLFLSPAADREEAAWRLRRLAGAWPGVTLRDSGELRRASLAVFDRTFAVTGVLRLLAVVVALVGVLASLLALGLERRRELAVLRVEGLTPRQVWAVVLGQSGLLGLFAGLAALPLGLALAAAMVFVVNRRSFGWSMGFAVEPRILVEAVALAVAAALLAGIVPAWRAARIAPAAALRGE